MSWYAIFYDKDAERVSCPKCGVKRRQHCRTPSGDYANTHVDRKRKAGNPEYERRAP